MHAQCCIHTLRSFLIAFIITGYCGCCDNSRSKPVNLWSWIVQQYSLALLTQSGLYLALIYYQTQISSDNGSRNPIAATVSSLIPGVLLAFLTWMVKQYISSDPMKGGTNDDDPINLPTTYTQEDDRLTFS